MPRTRGEAVPVKFRLIDAGEISTRRVGALTGRPEKGKQPKKRKKRWRISPSSGLPYLPIKERTVAGKKSATKLQRAACSAGAWAALSRGYAVSPRASCGPKGFGDRRSHRLLALWRHGSMSKFRKNPGKKGSGSVDFVWQPNEGGGKGGIEWAVIEPHSETVLKCGSARNPDSAHKAAMNIARDFTANPGKFVREIEQAIEEHEWRHHRPGMPYAGRDVEMKTSGEWTQVPKRNPRNKKAKKRKTRKGAARRANR